MDWISEIVITTTQSEKEVDVGACAMYAKQLSSPPSEKEVDGACAMYASVTDLCNPHLPFSDDFNDHSV